MTRTFLLGPGIGMAEEVLVAAIVTEDDETRARLAATLRETPGYRGRRLGPGEVADADLDDVDVTVVDWGLPDHRRSAIVRILDEAGVGVLATIRGVPDTDPIAEGADHEVRLPADPDSLLTALDVVRLQRRYAQQMAATDAVIAHGVGEGEMDGVIARADETLDELAEHVSYVDLFRRLFEE